MEPDDQQLVGRLSFDELSTDTAEMEPGGPVDSGLEVVPTTPWYRGYGQGFYPCRYVKNYCS
jgi:hypothetical protein